MNSTTLRTLRSRVIETAPKNQHLNAACQPPRFRRKNFGKGRVPRHRRAQTVSAINAVSDEAIIPGPPDSSEKVEGHQQPTASSSSVLEVAATLIGFRSQSLRKAIPPLTKNTSSIPSPPLTRASSISDTSLCPENHNYMKRVVSLDCIDCKESLEKRTQLTPLHTSGDSSSNLPLLKNSVEKIAKVNIGKRRWVEELDNASPQSPSMLYAKKARKAEEGEKMNEESMVALAPLIIEKSESNTLEMHHTQRLGKESQENIRLTIKLPALHPRWRRTPPEDEKRVQNAFALEVPS